MRNWWIRFGCFITGYNYGIVRNSSEVTAKAVKRYTSAILIVSVIWAFIGYTFTHRYLHGGFWGSISGAAILIIIIVQIERQIILSIKPGISLVLARGIIAGMMAIIGTIIVDQILFKEDIELEKITFIEERVRKALPPKTEELRLQIGKLDTTISSKEAERAALMEDISRRPNITYYSTTPVPRKETKPVYDSSTKEWRSVELSVPVPITIRSNVPNPNIERVQALEINITELRDQRAVKEKALIDIRPKLENEIGSKTGFLDELEVMYNLVTHSKIALIVWLIWFFFLFGLEMLVLISKANDKESDYERTVLHHMNLQIKRLDLLAKQGGAVV